MKKKKEGAAIPEDLEKMSGTIRQYTETLRLLGLKDYQVKIPYYFRILNDGFV